MPSNNLGSRPQSHSSTEAKEKSHALGRLIAPDLRDDAYRLGASRLALSQPSGRRDWMIDWQHRLPIDQGQTPRCVGFSIATALAVGPYMQRDTLNSRANAEKLANEIYLNALSLDEWDGEDPNNGTSVRAGMKAAQALGYVGSYVWASSVFDAGAFIRDFGPVVAGTVWPDSMMEADENGYLNIAPNSTLDGPNAQGHAFCLAQVNFGFVNPDGSQGRFVIPQTWGEGWGFNRSGGAYITVPTMMTLLAAQGEICCPMENKIGGHL